MSFTHFPFAIHNTKGNVLIWRTRFKPDYQSVFLAICSWKSRFKVKLWRFVFVKQIREENVKFVALYDFWRWILSVVMHLIVLVPLVTLLNAVVIPGFSWHIRDHTLTHHNLAVLLAFNSFFLINHVCELYFILLESLLLDFLEQLQTWVVKALIIHDVESNPWIQSSFVYFVCQILCKWNYIR